MQYATQTEKAEKLCEACTELGAKCVLYKTDFLRENETQAFIKKLTTSSYKIEKLISTIGAYYVGSPSTTPDNVLKSLFTLNCFSQVQVIRELLPILIANHASVVLMGVAGLNRSNAESYATAYSASKLSLLHIMRALAKEHIPHGLNLNMVSPGYIEGSVDLPSAYTAMLQKRALQVEEVLDAIQFFCSPSSKMITGQNLDVAGGVRL
jgi:NAD(P)-dependent dehydrogenase (short-subunit alcohol dehydrogenase family)